MKTGFSGKLQLVYAKQQPDFRVQKKFSICDDRWAQAI